MQYSMYRTRMRRPHARASPEPPHGRNALHARVRAAMYAYAVISALRGRVCECRVAMRHIGVYVTCRVTTDSISRVISPHRPLTRNRIMYILIIFADVIVSTITNPRDVHALAGRESASCEPASRLRRNLGL